MPLESAIPKSTGRSTDIWTFQHPNVWPDVSSFTSHVVLDGVAAVCGCPGQRVPTGPQPGPLWRAARAQNGSPTEQQPKGHKADIDRCPELPLQHLGYARVVEVSDDGVCRPGNSDHGGECRRAENDPGAQNHSRLHPRVAQAVGAACAKEEDEESQTSKDHADADEAAGCLEVWSQVEQGVIELTLQLTRVLADTGHPQALPKHLHDHQVGADEGCHLPHGQSTDQDGPSNAHHGQTDAQLLESHGTLCTLSDPGSSERRNVIIFDSFDPLHRNVYVYT